jgi:hypothetical protein
MIEPQAAKSSRVRRVTSKPAVLIAAGLVVASSAVVVALFLVRGPEGDEGKKQTLEGPRRDPFSIEYPRSWKPFSKRDLARVPGRPLAVLRRSSGIGSLVVRRQKAAPANYPRFAAQLNREFRGRLRDFRPGEWRQVNVRAGPAFLYTYGRQQARTSHSVLIVPAGAHSYAIDTVSGFGAQEVSAEIGRMLASFDVG